MAQDYANNILEAIEMIAAKRVNEAGYDKTIKAVVTSADQAAKGQYTCKYESVTFTAIGAENAYKTDDLVMVNIPQNNWSNPKTILNKIYSEVIDYNSVDPFADFLDVNDGKPLIFSTEEKALKANVLEYSSRSYTEEEIPLSSLTSIYTEPYTRMGLEISFKTKDLKQYYVNGGTYGIRIYFLDIEKDSILAQYELNTLNCFGNLYGFEDYSPQKVLIKLDPEIIKVSTGIRAEVFQLNDFTRYNTETGATERLVYDSEPNFNLFFKDLKLTFGYGKEEYKAGDIFLTTFSSLQYFKKWEERENTKDFSWIYWYKDSNGKLQRSFDDGKDHSSLPRAYLEYNINEKDWVNFTESSEYYDYIRGGGSYSYLFDGEVNDSPKVQIRIRIAESTFNTDSSQRNKDLFSNVLTFYRYEPVVTSQEIDETTALKCSYEYTDLDIYHYFKEREAQQAKGPLKFNTLEELQYNDMENQLYTQHEFICPHCVQIKWDPLTKAFRDPKYLAGATITYKVPAFEYSTRVLEKSKQAQATERFNFEATTIFMRPRAGYDYSTSNDTVRFETIDEITYMVWDITLGDSFIYDETLRNQYYNYGDADQSSWDTMQAFTLTFRPKEYYLPTMINNTIYCIIKKDNYEFTSSFEIPIKKVDLSETANKAFIFTEDFEKPYLISHKDELTDFYITEEKIFHFCIYQNNYNGTLNQKGPLNIMRPFGAANSYQSFDEDAEGFKKFLNYPEIPLGNYYWSGESIHGLYLPTVPKGLNYNFILKKYNNGEPIYYLYYFNILGDNNNSFEEFMPALKWSNENNDYVIQKYDGYDEFETYYVKVWPFGEYVEGSRFAVGDRVIYENNVYKCNDYNASTTEWESQYWDLINDDTILPRIGTEYNWVQIGSPTEEECENKRFSSQKYYIKVKSIFDLSNNIKCEFKHYATYFMESEYISDIDINRYTVSLEANKATYIQNNILSILNDYVISTQETYLKEGYWYYDDNHNYVPGTFDFSDPIQWYTLKCNSIQSENQAFLMLQTKIRGISTIKEIPVFFNNTNDLSQRNIYVIPEGMNKIYCDATGVISEKNIGPSEIPYANIYFYYPNSPVECKKNIDFAGQGGNLISYETNFDNVLMPKIETKYIEKASPIEILPPGYVISTGGNALQDYKFYILYNDEYIKGEFYVSRFTMVWSKNGETIKEVSLPYTVIESDEIYVKDTYSYTENYLRYDNVGFTINYKEVGSGNDFPAESVCIDSSYLPIVFQQRQLFRDDFAQWDGTNVYIGNDAVFSPVVGAGRKRNGEFSGCLMGDISTIDFSQSSRTNYYGLYGYHNNQQSFGLRADGTMFIGKNGKGQLVFDGNKSTIQSNSYATSPTNEKIGMLLDFDDGLIDIRNFKNNTSYFVKLDVTDNNLSLSDKPLKIGTGDNPKFSVDWTGQVYAKDISIDAGTLSGTIEAANNATINNVTIQNVTIKKTTSGGGSADVLKFDAEGNLVLSAGLKLGTNGQIIAGEAKLYAKDGVFYITGGLVVVNSENTRMAVGHLAASAFNLDNHNIDLQTIRYKDDQDQVQTITVLKAL